MAKKKKTEPKKKVIKKKTVEEPASVSMDISKRYRCVNCGTEYNKDESGCGTTICPSCHGCGKRIG